jgi:hypothetical protein
MEHGRVRRRFSAGRGPSGLVRVRTRRPWLLVVGYWLFPAQQEVNGKDTTPAAHEIVLYATCRNTRRAAVPEVFRREGYVFFFYSNEGQEPVHVHVRRAGGSAKFWMEPIGLDHSIGMKTRELARAEELIVENRNLIQEKWDETFGR